MMGRGRARGVYLLEKAPSEVTVTLLLSRVTVTESPRLPALLRLHVMIGCDRLYVQTQRVQNSCTRGILRLNLTSLAYADMASEH